MKRKPFTLEHLICFPHVLGECLERDGCQGGTIHQYLPRLSIGGPVRGWRYGRRPIVQVYLDNVPLERQWAHMSLADLAECC